MKNKALWLMVVAALGFIPCTYAAANVAPYVIPWTYMSDVGIEWDIPGNPDLTYRSEPMTYYSFGYNAGRDEFFWQPDLDGWYYEA